MNLSQLFETRQSTRAYNGEPVDEKTLESICRAAILAPSAINGQPYRLYAITGDKARAFTKYIQGGGANGWADSCASYIVIEALAPTVIDNGERVVTNAPFIGNDVGILTAYITLAAEDAGVQTCIVGHRDEHAIAKFLKLPDGTPFPLVIALGYKKDGYALRTKTRRDFSETFKLIK